MSGASIKFEVTAHGDTAKAAEENVAQLRYMFLPALAGKEAMLCERKVYVAPIEDKKYVATVTETWKT